MLQNRFALLAERLAVPIILVRDAFIENRIKFELRISTVRCSRSILKNNRSNSNTCMNSAINKKRSGTGEIVSLESLGDNERRLVFNLLRDLELGGNRANVVAVDRHHVPAKALGALLVHLSLDYIASVVSR